MSEKEVILMNEFWWPSELIPWETVLVLLEEEVVHFPLSKIISI